VTALAEFEQIGTRGFYRPTGSATLEQAIELGARAMKHARERGCVDLLLDTRGLQGFASPSVTGRYNLAVRWAESSGGQLRVAIVVPTEMMDPGKIAVLMAQNRGVSGDAFTNEADAVAWLDMRGRARPA
jgi:hypothetical protein